MNKIMRVAIWKNALLITAFLILELTGIGPIAMYRAGECYDLFLKTGHPLFWIIVYACFFLIWPILDLLAIILKPRLTINNYGMPGQ